MEEITDAVEVVEHEQAALAGKLAVAAGTEPPVERRSIHTFTDLTIFRNNPGTS